MAEVERVVHTRSASPATTLEQKPTAHEDLTQLESRVEARFQAFTRKVDLLREEFSQSLEMVKIKTSRRGPDPNSRI